MKKYTKEENAEFSAFASSSTEGLTKREYFACLAMQGLLTNNFVKLDITVNGSEFTNTDLVAQMSVAMADALLNELTK